MDGRDILIEFWRDVQGTSMYPNMAGDKQIDITLSSLQSYYRQKLLEKLGEKKELSKHDDHLCRDEFCYTCNESISEEEYIKYWKANLYNQLHEHVTSIIDEIFPVEKEV